MRPVQSAFQFVRSNSALAIEQSRSTFQPRQNAFYLPPGYRRFGIFRVNSLQAHALAIHIFQRIRIDGFHSRRLSHVVEADEEGEFVIRHVP